MISDMNSFWRKIKDIITTHILDFLIYDHKFYRNLLICLKY